MLRAPFVLRRTRSAWLLVSCLMVSVLITAALVSALISFYSVALPATVRHELTSSRAMAVTLTAETSGSAGPAIAAVTRRMHAAFGSVPYQQAESLWSNDLEVPGPRAAGNVPVLQAASVTGISAHAHLVSGTWPAAPRAGQPLAVALPASAAARLHLQAGSVLRTHLIGATAALTLRVTGVFRAIAPDSDYWRVDEIGPSAESSGGGFDTYGPAVVSPAALGPGGVLVPNQATFVLLPEVSKLKPGELTALADRLRAADAALTSGGNTEVSTALPATLVNVAAGLRAAQSLVMISGLQLLLLAGAALALAARLLASNRDEETALLAARGAARWQLLRPSLAEGLLACTVAAAAGAVGGAWLAAALLSGVVGRQHQQVSLGSDVWLAAAAVLAGCLLIVLWPALRPPDVAAVRVRRGRQAAVASAAAAGADIALIALAVVCVHELLSYSAASGSGIDPVIVAAPALALAGLALIPLRLLPLAARGLERMTARSRQLGTAMANWEISRRPVRQSGPALLVILAVATSTLALAQYQSWRQSVHDQAAFAAGSQVRVGLASAEPLSGVTGVTRLRGVTAAMPVGQQPLSNGQLLAIGGPQAAATVTMRSDLSQQVPVSRLWSYLGQRQGRLPGLAIPGRPERLAITASMTGGSRGQLGPVSATVTVQDRFGLAYELPSSMMPADGRPHQLIVRLGAASGIAYPLRLIGLSLTYSLAPDPGALALDGNSVIKFSSVAASAAQTGPFGRPFAAGQALAGWRARAFAPGLEDSQQQVSNGSLRPSVIDWGAAGQDAELTLYPGSGPQLPRGATRPEAGTASIPGQVQITIPPSPLGVPLIATSAFLRANGISDGSSVPVSIAGTSVPAYVVKTVSQFPTVTSGGAVIADQATLQDALVSAGGAPLPATSWWLSTAGGRPPGGLPPGSSVVVATALASSLEHDTVSAAPVRAALAVAAAAAVLAALGFCVSVAASARSRRAQRALLAALGVSSGAQARLFCLEELMISGPAALVGLGLGIGLAHLLVPAVTLTANAGLPIPPVLVRLPVAWVCLIVLAVPAIPVLAALITAVRQPDPAAQLRAAEAAG